MTDQGVLPGKSPSGRLKCPGCATTMVHEERAGVTIDHCRFCGLLWFDAAELDRQLAAEAKPSPHPAWEGAIPRRGESALTCPRCAPLALESVGWSELVFWRCPRCRGILVDTAEFPDLEQVDVAKVGFSVEQSIESAAYTAGRILLGDLDFVRLLGKVVEKLP